MLNHGVPPIVVSRVLGHAKPSTTMDIYGHLLSGMQDEVAKIMDEIVTPIPVDWNATAQAKNSAEKLHQTAPDKKAR